MKKLIYISIVFLTGCYSYKEPKDYQIVNIIWTDPQGNNLLRCFSHINAFVDKKDWLYEFTCNGEKKYHNVRMIKESGYRYLQSYYKDSLIIYHEDQSADMCESKEYWAEMDSISFKTGAEPDPRFSKKYLASKKDGVYKVTDSILIKVCDYRSDSNWIDIKNKFGKGLYYFGAPGMFYKESLNLKEISECN